MMRERENAMVIRSVHIDPIFMQFQVTRKCLLHRKNTLWTKLLFGQQLCAASALSIRFTFAHFIYCNTIYDCVHCFFFFLFLFGNELYSFQFGKNGMFFPFTGSRSDAAFVWMQCVHIFKRLNCCRLRHITSTKRKNKPSKWGHCHRDGTSATTKIPKQREKKVEHIIKCAGYEWKSTDTPINWQSFADFVWRFCFPPIRVPLLHTHTHHHSAECTMCAHNSTVLFVPMNPYFFFETSFWILKKI